jgi:hypothetical protein
LFAFQKNCTVSHHHLALLSYHLGTITPFCHKEQTRAS